MDVASRPSLELLPDLPVEEPLDGAAAAPQPPTLAAAGAAAAAPKDPEQTDLHFIDPELFMTPDQAAAVAPPSAPPAAPRATPESELTLEDPVIDEMLTSAAPPPPPQRTAPPTLNAVAVAPKPAAEAPRSTRVPIAKTAALSAAAAKVAAASAAQQRPVKPQAIAAPPVIVPARPAPAARPPSPGPKMEAAKSDAGKTDAAKAPAPQADTPASKPAVTGLAAWANARSAAATPATPSTPAKTAAAVPEPVRPAAAAPAPKPAAVKSAAPLPQPGDPAGSAVALPMDRDFIARNQVVERYLSGRLPLKGATDFERFCHAHPELLDELGLPERVNAGLRLLEASGKPEPWQEAPRPPWQKPQVTAALAAAIVVLGVALAAVAASSASKNHRIAALEKQALERALDPATSTREIRLLPSREGASNNPAITIGGGSTQLADFKIDETRSPYHAFRVTIDRIDQGRVAVITNLTKDTNGHLRLALNSSALGPGNYQLTIEGLNWRGEPEPDSWVTIGILR